MGTKHSKLSVNPPEEVEVTAPPSTMHARDDPATAGDQNLPLNDVEREDAQTLSPFWIEDILFVILGHVSSFRDLKTYRLVNLTWNAAATRVLRSRGAWIDFSLEERSYQDMKKLLEMLETSRWILPSTKFGVDTSFHQGYSDCPHEKQDVVDKFFRTVAPFVKELKLIDSSSIGGNRLFPLAPPPTDIPFPVLEKVIFELGEVTPSPWTRQAMLPSILESNLDFVRSILANAPRLVEVQSGYWDNRTDGTGLSCLTHLPRPLQKLTLVGNALQEQFRLLANLVGVRHLREFKLHFASQPIADPHFSETFFRFLVLIRDSLEVLVVSSILDLLVEDNDTRPQIRLPELPRLKKLNLELMCPVSSEQNSFPALQQWTLTQYHSPTREPIFNFASITTPMEHLTRFELSLSREDNTKSPFTTNFFLRHVARVMPNLRKLIVKEGLTYHEERLNVEVLAPLQHLEELSLFTIDGDAVLTGFSAEELAIWRGFSAEELKTMSRMASDPPPFFQGLRKLSIATTWLLGADITEVSCRLVFLRMANLKCLDLRECRLRPPGISAEVLEEMRRKFTVLPLDAPPPTLLQDY